MGVSIGLIDAGPVVGRVADIEFTVAGIGIGCPVRHAVASGRRSSEGASWSSCASGGPRRERAVAGTLRSVESASAGASSIAAVRINVTVELRRHIVDISLIRRGEGVHPQIFGL
jgi:hypothetical protein